MSAKSMISNRERIINDPREYQLELFEVAKERNTIAVLDTGANRWFPIIFYTANYGYRFWENSHRVSAFAVYC